MAGTFTDPFFAKAIVGASAAPGEAEFAPDTPLAPATGDFTEPSGAAAMADC